MVFLIIIAALIYVLAGMLLASNVTIINKRFENEAERQNGDAIIETNSRTIKILLVVGLFLGMPGALAMDLSLLAGIIILGVSFIVGIIIRIIMGVRDA